MLPFPIGLTLPLDGSVLALTTSVTLIAAVLCGLAPALDAIKTDVVSMLQDLADKGFLTEAREKTS